MMKKIILLFLLFFSFNAYAVPSYIGGGYATSGTGTTTYNYTASANSFIVVNIYNDDPSATITSVSDSKSNTYFTATSLVNRAQIYYANNTTSGANAITIVNSNSTRVNIVVLEYLRDGGTLTVDDKNDGGTFADDCTSGNITTTQANDLIIGFGRSNGGYPTAGTGFTLRDQHVWNYYIQTEEKIQTSAGITSANFTTTGTNTCYIQVVAFKDSSWATPTPTPVGTATPTPTATNTPSGGGVPTACLSTWESNMTTVGTTWCNYIQSPPNCSGLTCQNDVYYDGQRVYYNIKDYTGNIFWDTCAQRAEVIYRDRYVYGAYPDGCNSSGQCPGYWNFTTGLRKDYERTGDTSSRDAVLALSSNASFATCSGYETDPAQLNNPYIMREYSYALMSFNDREAIGGSARSCKSTIFNAITASTYIANMQTGAFTTTNRSRTSNVATITTSSAHTFVVGSHIQVTGLGGTGYNGEITVTAVTSNTFSYANTGSNEGTTADTSGIVGFDLKPFMVGIWAQSLIKEFEKNTSSTDQTTILNSAMLWTELRIVV